jgi:hypothetical protein
MTSCLYFGQVVHTRSIPVRHRFRYRVFSLYVDLDDLPALAKRLRLFGYNRPGLFSLHDRDHGNKDDEPPRAWAERRLRRAGIDIAGGSVRLLCFPRILGIVFNPLSLYFCHRPDGTLAAIIHEVHNTFGERHAYVLPVDAADAARGVVAQRCDKEFYVSPFIEMRASYGFRIEPPTETFSVLIREMGRDGEILRAGLAGRRAPMTDRVLLAAFFAYPLMTLKVVAAIHWQALRLWRKGVKYHKHVPQRRASVPPETTTAADLRPDPQQGTR